MSSDIGKSLALQYSKDGFVVVGTYRQEKSIADICGTPNIHFLQCDISDKENMKMVVQEYKTIHDPWDIFISCVGTMEPIGNFFTCDFDTWEHSIRDNSTAQLRFLHEIYVHHRKGVSPSDVVFIAGGSVNGTFKNYSAYCASKILLLKMCELLNDENDDLSVFSVGPGWVRTKLHNETLRNQKNAAQHYEKTLKFLEMNEGTNMEDIYKCINWCIQQGKKVVGGKNFSVVYDQWRDGGMALSEQLLSDSNKFKLRRFKNDE